MKKLMSICLVSLCIATLLVGCTGKETVATMTPADNAEMVGRTEEVTDEGKLIVTYEKFNGTYDETVVIPEGKDFLVLALDTTEGILNFEIYNSAGEKTAESAFDDIGLAAFPVNPGKTYTVRWIGTNHTGGYQIRLDKEEE